MTLPCPDPLEPPRVLDAIHKPTAGERPLDDFPDGTLTRREVAAYLVSEASGWDIVPADGHARRPVRRGDAAGLHRARHRRSTSIGWINDDDPGLRRMAAFDAAVNNTDRKGGHILPVDGGRHVYGVDHGVCFSVTPKLRTVLWGWRGQRLPAETSWLGCAGSATASRRPRRATFAALLSRAEVRATVRRVGDLLERGVFPLPSPTWPAIPWPPI